MKFFIRGLFLFALVIGLLIGCFSLYAQFLMDYSLDSLTVVASAARQNSASDDNLSITSQNVYRSMVQDMALEEASQDDIDMENLALLDLASRSLDEAKYRAGYARANVYLNKIMANKKPKRNIILVQMDYLTKSFWKWMESARKFLGYALSRVSLKKQVEKKIGLEDYASSLLLNQAQDREMQGFLSEAEAKYKKFMELYKNHPNRSMAAISLANILIRERKFAEARRFLQALQPEFYGRGESDLISKLLQRIDFIETKQQLILKLKDQMLKEKSASARQAIFLRLGVAYMATHQLEKAENIFLKLSELKDSKIRQKAGFYLGWIYKSKADYGKSARVFNKLLTDSELEAELELGVRAQLADVYYKRGDVEQSVEQYRVVSVKGNAEGDSAKSNQSAWTSFSELELVNIYSFDLKNTGAAREHMDKLINLAETANDYKTLETTLERAGKITLRDLAFQALVEKKVTRALDFFTKYLSQHPDDALTHTGLATVYALMGDMENALVYAKKGFEGQSSEYATLMLGYIEGLRGDYQSAIKRYRQVLSMAPDSSPAKFNLAYIYLKIEEYQKALDIMLPLEETLKSNEDKKFLRAKTLNNIGYCYWGLGNSSKDVEYFRKALDVMPDFDIAKRNLSETRSRSVAPEASDIMD